MIDVIDDGDSSLSRTATLVSWLIGSPGLTDAVPFFELIRSDISRSRARLGSKF